VGGEDGVAAESAATGTSTAGWSTDGETEPESGSSG